MNTPLNIGNVPQGFCPSTWQAALNGIGAALSVDIPAASGFSIGSTKPADTSQVWFRIDSLGRFLGIYIFGQGSWLSAHPSACGLTMWWFAALPNFTTFDGGDSNSVGPASGPMWQQAQDGNGTVIAAKFVITAGTLPSATVLSIGGTGGEETHILTAAEGAQDPNHKHISGRFGAASGGGADDGYFFTEASTGFPNGTAQRVTGGSGGITTANINTLGGNYIQSGVVDPQPATPNGHNTLPLYAVGYLLQRTARIFYSVT
jgi:hypothetical protein